MVTAKLVYLNRASGKETLKDLRKLTESDKLSNHVAVAKKKSEKDERYSAGHLGQTFLRTGPQNPHSQEQLERAKRCLYREGFKLVEADEFHQVHAKNFSGVVTKIYVFRPGFSGYQWKMEEKAFRDMVGKLKDAVCLKKQKMAAAYSLTCKYEGASAGLSRVAANQKKEEFNDKFSAIGRKIAAIKDNLWTEYQEFFNMQSRGVRNEPPYERIQQFFMDCCHTDSELALFLKFVRYFKELYFDIKYVGRHERFLTAQKRKHGIVTHYMAEQEVGEIQDAYKAAEKHGDKEKIIGDLAKRYELPVKTVEELTKPGEGRKEWNICPYEWGLKMGSQAAGNKSPKSFEKVLISEPEFASRVKSILSSYSTAQIKAARDFPEEIKHLKLKSEGKPIDSRREAIGIIVDKIGH